MHDNDIRNNLKKKPDFFRIPDFLRTFWNELEGAWESLFCNIRSIWMEDERKGIVQGNPQPRGYFSTITSSKRSFNEAFVLWLSNLREEVQIFVIALWWRPFKKKILIVKFLEFFFKFFFYVVHKGYQAPFSIKTLPNHLFVFWNGLIFFIY